MLEVLGPRLVCTFTGEIKKMSESRPFTVASFYKFLDQERLMVAKCTDCGCLILPPKPMCTSCLSANLEWVELEGKGKLLAYSIIHVAPEQFQSMVPYTVGIVEFKNGVRLPGIICDVKDDDLKVGLKLKIDFGESQSSEWHSWGRYCFKPL